MRKVLLLCLLVAGGIVSFLFLKHPTKEVTSPIFHPQVSITIKKNIIRQGEKKISVFVPYWGLSQPATSSDFERYIYFGISANENGIDTDEVGYKRLSDFNNFASGKETYLTVRLIDAKINSIILKDRNLQQKLITDTISIAKQNHFSGIVLDLETPSFAFESVTKKISDLISDFSHEVKKEQLFFAIAVYGDTYYRARPYDIELIGKEVDEILIMAYDFHKSRGNPGPNFPFNGKELYGYDFKTMLNNFLQEVPKEKLTPVFGMFGYDWVVDKEYGSSISSGQPLSTSAVKLKFIDSCSQLECKWVREEKSGEINISYKDEEGKYHVIWFEDEDSVAKKRNYLKEHGINSYAYWAYSYF